MGFEHNNKNYLGLHNEAHFAWAKIKARLNHHKIPLVQTSDAYQSALHILKNLPKDHRWFDYNLYLLMDTIEKTYLLTYCKKPSELPEAFPCKKRHKWVPAGWKEGSEKPYTSLTFIITD